MSFKKHTPEENTRDYKISLKSPKTGNTVAFINLSEQFIKSATGKTKKTVTFEEIQSINSGHLVNYLRTLDMELEELIALDPIDASDY